MDKQDKEVLDAFHGAVEMMDKVLAGKSTK